MTFQKYLGRKRIAYKAYLWTTKTTKYFINEKPGLLLYLVVFFPPNLKKRRISNQQYIYICYKVVHWLFCIQPLTTQTKIYRNSICTHMLLIIHLIDYLHIIIAPKDVILISGSTGLYNILIPVDTSSVIFNSSDFFIKGSKVTVKINAWPHAQQIKKYLEPQI